MIPGTLRGITAPGKLTPYPIVSQARILIGILYSSISFNNSTTAWLYGASGVNCSLFGIGERTGNTPLEAMVFEYAQLKGTLDGMDTTVITELAEYFEKELGYVQPSRTPFVGKNVLPYHMKDSRTQGVIVFSHNYLSKVSIFNFLQHLPISSTNSLSGHDHSQ